MLGLVKLIALDIDGTLLDDDGDVSEKTVAKMKELILRGIYVILVTGRVHKSALSIANNLSLDISIISNNGGKIVVPQIGQIYESKIPIKEVKKVFKYGEKEDI